MSIRVECFFYAIRACCSLIRVPSFCSFCAPLPQTSTDRAGQFSRLSCVDLLLPVLGSGIVEVAFSSSSSKVRCSRMRCDSLVCSPSHLASTLSLFSVPLSV